jgi:hypothetical protein
VPEAYLPEVADNNKDDARRRANAKIVERLRAAATIIELGGTVDDELPEVISVGVTTEQVSIHPWKPGAPVTAMRQFEALMTGPIERKAHPVVLTGAEQVSLLTATGMIDGLTVTVQGATHQDTPVDGFLGVTEQTEATLATTEIAIVDPGDSVVLPELIEEMHGGPGQADPADSGPPAIGGPAPAGAEGGAAGADGGAGD